MSEDEKKSPLEEVVGRALNLFFYAPIGLLLGADDVVPDLVQRGKQQVAAARMFGEYALETEVPKRMGQLQKQAETMLGELTGRRPQAPVEPPDAPVDDATTPATPAGEAADTPAAAPAVRAQHGPSVGSLAIPDYDSLSASQVVPRLAGLSAEELEAVRTYESGHRGRKTILNRVDQLQQ